MSDFFVTLVFLISRVRQYTPELKKLRVPQTIRKRIELPL